MNDMYVMLTLAEVKEVRDFIAGNYTDCYSDLNENPDLVSAWCKLREAARGMEVIPDVRCAEAI